MNMRLGIKNFRVWKFSFGIEELRVDIVTLPKGKNTVMSRISVMLKINNKDIYLAKAKKTISAWSVLHGKSPSTVKVFSNKLLLPKGRVLPSNEAFNLYTMFYVLWWKCVSCYCNLFLEARIHLCSFTCWIFQGYLFLVKYSEDISCKPRLWC